MRGRSRFTILLIICFSTMCGQSPEVQNSDNDVTAELVEFGTFETGPGEPGTRESNFTAHGDEFTGRLGLQFGFRLTLTNLPDSEWFEMKTYVTHPPIKDKNGETRTRYALLTTVPVKNRTSTSVTGYRFDRPDEMTPGVWTFTHVYRGKTLVTKSFTIRPSEVTR